MSSRPTISDEQEAVVNMLLSVVYGYPERTTVSNDDTAEKLSWLHDELRDEHEQELQGVDLQEFLPE
jgi:hypothetical protein